MFLDLLNAQTMTGLLTEPYNRGAETLAIPLGADSASGTAVPDYEFSEYVARYQSAPPLPKYVLFPRVDIGPGGLTVEIDYLNGGSGTATVTIPPLTFAGTSFVIPTPVGAGAALRIVTLRQTPVPLPGIGAANFGVVALLGNIAKLAFVLGWEKDQLRQLLRQVRQQRSSALAQTYSLDLLGQDLRVPRFPPRSYSYDPDTIALYHLDEASGFSDQTNPAALTVPVFDEMALFNQPGHAGVNAGANIFAVGKFGFGYGFPGTGGAAAATVPHDPAFNIAANGSFTLELFLKAVSVVNPVPRFLIRKGLVDATGTLTAAGWSLALVTARNVTNNVVFAISDGSHAASVFADADVADGRFHHLAAVLDRTSKRLRLFLDGTEQAAVDASAVGAMANTAAIQIGSGAVVAPAVPFSGFLDEIRLSRVVRTAFNPALGEDDDSYRRRLRIFQRWFLPTASNLIAAINDLVQINNDPQSFMLIEKLPPAAVGSKLVDIVPALLSANQSIDATGNTKPQEAGASGVPQVDTDFNPIYLTSHNRMNVAYGSDPNNHLMQIITAATLDALIDRIAALSPPVAGNLNILRAYNPSGTGLDSIGRALQLQHDTLGLAQLGALAHRAGFTFVQNVLQAGAAYVYVSVPVADKLTMAVGQIIATATQSGSTATVTTSTAHNFQVGSQVVVSGASVPGYNGTYAITAVTPTSFQYTPAGSGLTNATGGTAAPIDLIGPPPRLHVLPAQSITTASQSGTTVTITTMLAHNFQVGMRVAIAGVSVSGYNGSYVVSAVTATTFQYTAASPGLANATGGTAITDTSVTLSLVPASLPASGTVQWTLILPGTGQAHFAAHPADAPTVRTAITARPHLRLVADAPGEVDVKVEFTYQGNTVSGTRSFHIGIGALLDQASIAADGSRGAGSDADEDAALGSANTAPNPIYLITSNVATVNYGANSNNQKMLIVAEKPFLRLTTMPGVLPGLQVVEAYNPTDVSNRRYRAGRALLLTHPTIAADVLGALAHQAGFDYVLRQGNQIYCSVAEGELVEIVQAPGLTPLGDELLTGLPVQNIATATQSGATVTLTTTAAHSFQVGMRVVVTGVVTGGVVATSGYNGAFTITAVSSTTLQYAAISAGLANGTGGQATAAGFDLRVRFDQLPSQAIATATESGTTVTITTVGAHGYQLGMRVAIAGVSVAGYNGNFTINAVTTTTFQYKAASSGLANGTGGTAAAGDFHWTVQPTELGNGSFDFSQRPELVFTPTATGGAVLQVTYFEPAERTVAPYSFEIRFKPELDVPSTILPKDQYDLIMNLLNYFHPVGVQVITANLRQYVKEIQQNPQLTFPAYTYPDFRI